MSPAIRAGASIAAALLAVGVVSFPAAAQEATGVGQLEEAVETSVPSQARLRIVLNGAFWLGSNPGFTETRRVEEYAEETTIRASYETGSALGPDLAVQGSFYRGFGVRVGYSLASRDQSGTVEVSRPHPLYFDRAREASAELGGLSYSEGALHLDAAYARTAGHLDWTLFAGVTLFRVEADLLGDPTYTDVYPYDELVLSSTPTVTAEASPVGFNVGGGLDYRFGSSGRFGVGIQLLYSTGDAELQAAPEAETVGFKTGGLQAAAGVRVYF
jgi:hypothetical protein